MATHPPPAAPIIALPLGLRREGGEVAAGMAFAFGPCDEAATAAALHPEELRVWRDFRFERRRQSYGLGRLAAKAALAPLLPGLAAPEIEVAAGVFGQPVVRGPVGPVEVSIAHSRGAAVAVASAAGHPVGVDLEWIDPERESTIEGCISPRERNLWEGTGLSAREASFLSWTGRESLAKALRCGLMLSLDLLELDQISASGRWTRALFPHFPQYAVNSWLVGGFALALTTPQRTAVSLAIPAETASGLAAAAALD